jgi:hypothetical protein
MFVSRTPQGGLVFRRRGFFEPARIQRLDDAILALRPAKQVNLPAAIAAERQRRGPCAALDCEEFRADGASYRRDHEVSLEPLDFPLPFAGLDFASDFDSDFAALFDFSPFDFDEVPSDAFLSASAAFL